MRICSTVFYPDDIVDNYRTCKKQEKNCNCFFLKRGDTVATDSGARLKYFYHQPDESFDARRVRQGCGGMCIECRPAWLVEVISKSEIGWIFGIFFWGILKIFFWGWQSYHFSKTGDDETVSSSN